MRQTSKFTSKFEPRVPDVFPTSHKLQHPTDVIHFAVETCKLAVQVMRLGQPSASICEHQRIRRPSIAAGGGPWDLLKARNNRGWRPRVRASCLLRAPAHPASCDLRCGLAARPSCGGCRGSRARAGSRGPQRQDGNRRLAQTAGRQGRPGAGRRALRAIAGSRASPTAFRR